MPSDRDGPDPHVPPSPDDGGERLVEADEVRARRLIVTDAAGVERIVAEVVAEVPGSHAELRVNLAGNVPGHRSMVVLAAGEDPDLGPRLGLEIWADGNELAGLDAWQEDVGGPWQASIHGATGQGSDTTA